MSSKLSTPKQESLRSDSKTEVITSSPEKAMPLLPTVQDGEAAKVSAEHFVSYDENLLERANTQWQFGDWENLAHLERDTLQHHPDRAKLALLAAVGCLQTGKNTEAEQYIRLAQKWGVSRKLVSQFLIAGVYNSLGRAATIAGNYDCALKHFEFSVQVSTPGADVRLLTQARIAEQLQQIGLPATVLQKLGVRDMDVTVLAKATLPEWIQFGLKSSPDNPPLLIAAAESAQRNGDLDAAICYWQRLAAIEGSQMEQTYYERLGQAYKQLKSFPLGSSDEEMLRGDVDKHLVLKRIHQILQPRNYMEIGVQTGRSLQLANCPAIGIDPMPMLRVSLSDRVRLVRATSDQFFAESAAELITAPIDMAFIDGMHLFEYALRDFINIERYSGPHTLIVIDDILPGHQAQAARDRRTRAWTGDVWKLHFALRKYRPDLSFLLLDAHPTGLLCISGLNPNSNDLQRAYKTIVDEYPKSLSVPDSVISRADAISCNDPKFDALLSSLMEKRRLGSSLAPPA